MIINKFEELSNEDVHIAGGKGASLGEMTQAKIPVPKGFVILSSAFDKFIQENAIKSEIENILKKINIEDISSINDASEKIKYLILNAKMSKDVANQILKEFKKLNAKFVAVRSSATAEDSDSATWAGQLDTFLNTTRENLLENIQKCWASLFTPRAIFYRFEQKLHEQKISVAVVIQKMVESKESGIAFSVHPVTQDRNQLIIEAGYGLGEAVVSGLITPNSYVVDKQGFKILNINVNKQTKALYKKSKGGNKWKNLGKKGEQQVLTKKEIIELSKLIVKIEKHYGFPVDIEWAREKGKFFITQSRPITTLSEKIKEDKNISIYEDIKNNLKIRDLSIQNAQGSFFITNSAFKEYVKFAKKIGINISIFCYNNSDNFYQIMYKQDAKQIEKYLYKIFENEGSIQRLIREHEIADKKLRDFWEKNPLEKIPEEQFLKFIKEFKNKLYNSWAFLLFGEAKGIYLEKQAKKTFAGTYEELSILTHPKIKTAMSESYELILKKILEPKSITYEKYIEDFFWVQTSFFDRKVITKKIFEEILKKEKKRGLNEIKKEYKKNLEQEKKLKNQQKSLKHLINKDLKNLQEFITWGEYRKASMMKSVYYVLDVIHKIAKELNIDFKSILLYDFDEIIEFIQSKKIISNKEILEKRKISFNAFFSDKTERWFGNEAKELFNFTKKTNALIKGSSACKGKVKGIARVIFNPEKIKFNKGEILVTSMTRVEFLPIMRQASAFVTNEGGIACHAAIISREMNIPCIIGTKNATEIIKDGDLIEVDADRGVVKILKEKK